MSLTNHLRQVMIKMSAPSGTRPSRISTPLGQSNAPSTHRRLENHRPNTIVSEKEETYYILSLQTDPTHHRTMCALRERYYPPALLRVSAHISLFRALPGSILPSIRADIGAAVARMKPFGIRAVGPPIPMGRGGVGVSVTGLEPVEELVKDLQAKWHGVLSRQDRGAFRGHYTLMNKENDWEKVSRCLEEVRRELEPEGCPGMALGLRLWRYDNGWWRHEEDLSFSGVEDRDS
ncbi:hypothetical protein F5Y05DRAFT_369444 [Hypoxylon sp. FL0543]|nr:hypothetical protein F5Y05DRAFT_369444 [Hypoxylon sp. FL0543]